MYMYICKARAVPAAAYCHDLQNACLHVRMHSCMYVRLRARVCQVYRHIPIATGAHAHACKHAATRMRTAVWASSFRDRGGGHARRAAAGGAHARDRVCALYRRLYVRNAGPLVKWDNPALTCIPLTQARIRSMQNWHGRADYRGPADTCEASARAMHAHVLAPDARARGGVLAVLLGVGLARCSSFALPAGLSNMCVRARARALVCVRVCARERASM